MNILIDINHPAHVHFFKHAIRILRERGHRVIITASKKEISFELLDEYGLQYVNLGNLGKSLASKILNLLIMDFKMFLIMLKEKPDVALGIASARICHASFFFKTRAYVFDDTEHSRFERAIFKPFATKIFTPSCYLLNIGEKQVRYEGYHELAYLHPKRFTPNSSILQEINVLPGEKYFVVRFVSWGAVHDIGHKGFSSDGKRTLVKLLEKHGKVFITSEANLPPEFDKYLIKVSPIKIHDLLAYAEMYVGEGGTMATEAAILGTVSILVSSLTAGIYQELENKFELKYTFQEEKKALVKIEELLQHTTLKQEWAEKRKKLLKQKIDVSEYIVNIVANTANK